MPTTTGTATEITLNSGTPMPGELHIEVDIITVESATATKPDPTWTHTDAAGHWHAYDNDGKLPTLEPRTRHVDCDGIHDFGDQADEDCDGYDVTDWHCRICGEQVEPKRLPDRGPREIPGRKHWWVQLVTDREIAVDRAVVRVKVGDRLYFGVAAVRTESMEGDSHGFRVTSRIDGIGPLGERRG